MIRLQKYMYIFVFVCVCVYVYEFMYTFAKKLNRKKIIMMLRIPRKIERLNKD
jgi:hypothetical protein